MLSLNFKEIPIDKVDFKTTYYGYKYVDDNQQEHVQLGSFKIDPRGILLIKEILPQAPKGRIISCFSKADKKEVENKLQNLPLILNKYSDNLIGLHHDLYDVGEASQSKWHVWLTKDWRRLLLNIERQNCFIVGIAPSPTPISGTARNPVAIVYEEYSSGNRFWSHIEKDWIALMRFQSQKEYEKINK